ncbi:MAG: nucleotidyltransferase domain-containing protein [Coriobacteriia bacterium]|nr:nucleotidyltransferase domain-containing protein [Coriobacteriia bacterium]
MSALLTPRQVAERLAVSSRTVYLWIEEGRLPAVRLSERVTRVPAEAVDALIERSTHPATPSLPQMTAEAPVGYAATSALTEAESSRATPAELLRGLLSEQRAEIIKIAARRRVDNLRMIGSVARGDAHEGSDIDLLVDLKPSASLYDLSGFAGELEALLGVKVDVVPAGSVKQGIRERVLREAVPL